MNEAEYGRGALPGDVSELDWEGSVEMYLRSSSNTEGLIVDVLKDGSWEDGRSKDGDGNGGGSGELGAGQGSVELGAGQGSVEIGAGQGSSGWADGLEQGDRDGAEEAGSMEKTGHGA